MSNVYLDLETTGLNPNRNSIWEVGLVTDNNEEYSYILELTGHERGSADSMALAVGHYYERALPKQRQWDVGIDRPPPNTLVTVEDVDYITVDHRKDLAAFLAEVIATSHVVGAVPSFDARFLDGFLRDYEYPPAWHYQLVDVEALAAGKLGLQPPWKSKDLYRALGIDPTAFDEHTALGDARMAKAVYERVFDLSPSYPEALLVQSKEEEIASATDAAA